MDHMQDALSIPDVNVHAFEVSTKEAEEDTNNGRHQNDEKGKKQPPGNISRGFADHLGIKNQ